MRTRLVATVLVVVVVCGTVTGLVGGQFAQSTEAAAQGTADPTRIDSCTTITEPGRYVLSSDVENSTARTCIRVLSSDVVLDGDGHVVDGVDEPDPVQLADRFFRGQENPLDPETNVGVSVGGDESLSNVTVTDLRVTNWRWGVVTADLRDGRVADVRATGNGFGVAVTGGSDVSVTDSVASDNAGIGVALLNVTDASATNVTAAANGLVGVYQFGGRGATLSRISARGNELAGVLANEATDTTVFAANASGSRFGIYFFGTTGGSVARSTAANNDVGVYFEGATGGTVRGSIATDNEFAGVYVGNSTDATVAETTARDNLIGVLLQNTAGSSVVNATATRNRFGVYLFRSADGRVEGSDVSRNDVGVRLETASESVVTDSVANDQALGVWVVNSTGGAVVDNTVLNTSFAAVYVNNSSGVRVANNEDGLVTFESTGDDELGREGGIAHDADIEVNQTDGLTDAELRRYVYRAIARTEQLRQLEFTGSIELDVITRTTLERRGGLSPTPPAEQSAWDNQFWEALFVIGEQENATTALRSDDTRALGYYSSQTNRLTMVSDQEPPVISSTTLVHELVHALQDQHFNGTRSESPVRTEDGLRGRLGLTEGDAEYINEIFDKRCGVVWDCVQIPSREPPGGEVSADRNFASRAIILVPYSDGPQYVHELRQQGGWEAVNRAYEDPPVSTEQILHPERRNETPVPIEFENTARDGWRQFDAANLTGLNDDGRTTVGEAGIFTMFWYQGYEYDIPVVSVENYLVPNDAPFDEYNYTSAPSAGWGNDVLVPYRNGDQFGYVWETAWDTERDARQFHEAYLRMLRGHGAEQVAPGTWVIESGTFADAFRVVRNGTTVTITNGPTVESLDSIRPREVGETPAPSANGSKTADANATETTTSNESETTNANATETPRSNETETTNANDARAGGGRETFASPAALPEP